MLKLCLISVFSLVLTAAGFCLLNHKGKFGKNGSVLMEGHYIAWLLIAAFLFRSVLAAISPGHPFDIGCFLSWSSHIYEGGIGSFYSGDFFADYPPGYLYILYVIGWLRHIMGLTGNDGLSLFLIKLPAIICDILMGCFIYRSAKGKMSFTGILFCLSVYMFLPAVYINSSIWGQVDSVYALMLLLLLRGISVKKLPLSYAAFGIGILIKPQMLFFAPILILAIIDQVFLKDFSIKRFFCHLGSGIAAIGAMVLLALPFGLDLVISQYLKTIASYPYASINAYNFWTMLGFNWSSQNNKLLGISLGEWGTFFIILACLAVFLLWLREKKKDASFYYFLAGTLMLLLFTFSSHMHERYAFPAMALFLLAFIEGKRKMDFYIFSLVSTLQYLNVAHVFYFYDAGNFDRKALVPVIIGAGTVLVCLGTVVYGFMRDKAGLCREDALSFRKKKQQEERKKGGSSGFCFKALNPMEHMQKKEWIFLIMLMSVYGFIAFYGLGSLDTPQTFYIQRGEGEKEDMNESITLNLGKTTRVGGIAWYLGGYEERSFHLEASKDGEHFYIEDEILMDSVFRWEKHETDLNCNYIRLTGTDSRFSIGELVILDSSGKQVEILNSREYPELFDEAELYPKEFTYRNGTYFDEIYHARTAYEYINGLYSYENTHPPLGKILIALGIKIFGMCPFGWRFMGTLTGVLMVPLFYLFLRRLLRDQGITAMAGTVLFTFDFMHFTQTRIATIDVFVTFFIMGAYYFMYKYASMNYYETGLKPTLVPLGLSGFFMGLAIASKWTGIYAGAGLAVIFFATVYLRAREYRYAGKNIKGNAMGFSHEKVVNTFQVNLTITLSLCLVFFILVPAIIYTLSYIPFKDSRDWGFIPAMIRNQKTMFNYHSGLEATHYYSSSWYQWPVIFKPILYYYELRADGRAEGISAMGNPMVWWIGIAAFLYMLYLAVKKRDGTALFLVIGYLSQYVPWMFVTRCTFIYHYFPSVPFVAMMTAYGVKQMVLKEKAVKWLWLLYTALAVGLFAMFYPVISGTPVNPEYVDRFLRWFDSWVLLL